MSEDEITIVVDSLNRISKCLNHGSEKEVMEGVRKFMRCEHRTLQQLFMRCVLVTALEQLRDNGSDLRNQASHEVATQMLDATAGRLYFPFI